MPKTRNIIIFIAIAAAFALVYFTFIKKDTAAPSNLISGTSVIPQAAATSVVASPSVANDFLTLLLSVDNIKLNDAIFSDKAFTSLDDSHSILLVPDGNEGRINPFAPFGSETGVGTPDSFTAGGAAGTGAR